MTQYGRPSSTITDSDWTANGGPTDLWDCVNESVAVDTDYIRATGNQTCELKFSAVTDPVSSSSHILNLRANSTGSGGVERWTVTVYQGVTAIAIVFNNTTVTRGYANYSYTLSAAQADAITDYTDLRVRIVSNQGAAETLDVSWIEFSFPDAPATIISGSSVLTGSGLQRFIGLNNALGRLFSLSSGTLFSSSFINILSSSTLSGSSNTLYSGLLTSFLSSALSGQGALISSGTRMLSGDGNLFGISFTNFSGIQISDGNTVTYSMGDLNGDGNLEVISNSLIAGSSEFNGSSFVVIDGKPYLVGNGDLYAGGTVITFIVASTGFISPLFILGLSSLFTLVSGEALLSGNGQLNIDAFLSVLGSSRIYSSGNLSSDSLLEVLGSSALSVLGDLDGNGLLEILSGSGFVGYGDISASAETISGGIVTAVGNLLGLGSLGADGSVTSFGTVIMTVIGDIDGDGNLEILFQSSVSGYGELIAIADVISSIVQDVCGCIIIVDTSVFDVTLLDEAI